MSKAVGTFKPPPATFLSWYLSILYYPILCYTILYDTIRYDTILYYLYYTIYTILSILSIYTIYLYYTILYYAILYYTIYLSIYFYLNKNTHIPRNASGKTPFFSTSFLIRCSMRTSRSSKGWELLSSSASARRCGVLRGVICALLSSATWGWGPMCNV